MANDCKDIVPSMCGIGLVPYLREEEQRTVTYAVRFHKIDGYTQQGLGGAQITILDENYHEVKEFISSSLSNTLSLPKGTYHAVEHVPPDGYVQAEGVEFEVTSGDNLVVLENIPIAKVCNAKVCKAKVVCEEEE